MFFMSGSIFASETLQEITKIAAHHWYGATAYDAQWRASVVYWIAGSVLVMYSLLYIYWKNVCNITGKIALYIFLFSAVILQAGFIMFECIYSHFLKNILFFADMSQSILQRLYPAPA